MPFTQDDLAKAGKASLDFYMRNKPVDQVAIERPLLKKLQAGKKSFPGGKQYVTAQARKAYNSNFQWYKGDAQVSYNKRDTLVPLSFAWSGCHDGFSLNEDELLQNGITMTDDKTAVASDAEIVQLTNIMDENAEVLRLGFQEKLDYELHRDGTQGADAIPGLDNLISLTPATGVVGGVDRATNTWWRNYASTGINVGTQGTLIQEMEKAWRANTRNGGRPDFIVAGPDFIDAFRKDAKGDIQRYIIAQGKGGDNLDPSVSGLQFQGVPIIWDPVFDDLQANLAPGTSWLKRCYFINTNFLKMRPAEGHDMVTRNPPRVYDRYTNYWGLTSKLAMVMTRANCHSVLSIA